MHTLTRLVLFTFTSLSLAFSQGSIGSIKANLRTSFEESVVKITFSYEKTTCITPKLATGFVISNYHIITAAHTFKEFELGVSRVCNVSKLHFARGISIRPIALELDDESYIDFDNDFAILRFKEPVFEDITPLPIHPEIIDGEPISQYNEPYFLLAFDRMGEDSDQLDITEITLPQDCVWQSSCFFNQGIDAGNSGGPIVNQDGQVVAFARASEIGSGAESKMVHIHHLKSFLPLTLQSRKVLIIPHQHPSGSSVLEMRLSNFPSDFVGDVGLKIIDFAPPKFAASDPAQKVFIQPVNLLVTDDDLFYERILYTDLFRLDAAEDVIALCLWYDEEKFTVDVDMYPILYDFRRNPVANVTFEVLYEDGTRVPISEENTLKITLENRVGTQENRISRFDAEALRQCLKEE